MNDLTYLLKVNNVSVKPPSEFGWGLQDVSAPDAGRDLSAEMHKGRVAQKRKISLGWNNPTITETAAILQAFNPEYVEVNYLDAMSGTFETRTFYVGDRTAPLQSFTVGERRWSKLSFDIIEK